MFKFSTTHLLNDISGVKVIYEKDGPALIVGRDNKIKGCTILNPATDVDVATPTSGNKELVRISRSLLDNANVQKRLYVYIESVGDANPLFATDFKHKGKPFYVEFKNAADLVDITDKGQHANPFFFGESLVKAKLTDSQGRTEVTVEGETTPLTDVQKTHLELTLATENLRFHEIALQVLSTAEGAGITPAYVGDQVFTTTNVFTGTADGTFVTHVTKGNIGFGTNDYILHNLRLPTNANLRLYSINGEMPVKDRSYTQYIIKTVTERPEMQGTSVLGQYNQSVTKHILWIPSDADTITAFNNMLLTIVNEDSEVNTDTHKWQGKSKSTLYVLNNADTSRKKLFTK